MLKVLLVEDEAATRRGLREKIGWQEFDMQVVAEAEDGLEGVRMAQKHRPDLIVLDVRMPRMDGIACAQAIRANDAYCAIVFISGFSDKEYLKAAIHLGALEYIEKPLQLPAVCEVLERVRTLLEKRRGDQAGQEKQLQYRQLAYLFFQDHPKEQQLRALAEQLGLRPVGGYPFVTLILRPILMKAPSTQDDPTLACEKAVAKAMTGWRGFFLYVQWRQNQIALHCELTASLTGLLERLGAALKEGNPEYEAQYCVGKTVSTLARLPASAQDALMKQAAAFLFPPGAVIQNLSLKRVGSSWHEETFARLCAYAQQGNLSAFLTLMDQMETVMAGSHHPQDLMLHMRLLARIFRWLLERYMALANYENADMVPIHGDMAEVCQSGCLQAACALIRELAGECQALAEKLAGQGGAVRASIQYISKYYPKDISLDSVAEAVGLSANYLGGIFKNETGITIRQFIENTRIEEAKRLMASPTCKLIGIPQQVGFNSYSYFVSVFKRSVGLTPTEYRKGEQP